MLVFRSSNSPKASRSLPAATAPAPLHITAPFRCSNSPKVSRSLPAATAPAPLHITVPFRSSNSPKASRSLPAATAPAPLHITAPLSDTTTARQCLQCCCQSATAMYIFYLDHIKTSARDWFKQTNVIRGWCNDRGGEGREGVGWRFFNPI